MKIRGSRTEYFDVEVSELDMLASVVELAKKKTRPRGVPQDAYLNNYDDKWFWESWDPCRGGSGRTTWHCEATDQEVRDYNTIKDFEALVHRREST